VKTELRFGITFFGVSIVLDEQRNEQTFDFVMRGDDTKPIFSLIDDHSGEPKKICIFAVSH
jgi:hypothetical protein